VNSPDGPLAAHVPFPLSDDASFAELHLARSNPIARAGLADEHKGRITGKAPWTSAKMTDGAMDRMLRMILPFRLRIVSVDGTWKLNRNKPPEVRTRAAEALANGDAAAQAIATLMRGRLRR